MALTVSAFLQDTAIFPMGVLAKACSNLRRRQGYPPSSGDLVAECGRVAHEQARARAATNPRLPRRPRGVDAVPAAERDAVRARIQAEVDDCLRQLRAPLVALGGRR
ncbi:hypothetical protein DSM21852_11570 [Methylocystis bryophila]|nr:hypothetical protein DSM21852_11570 [Methylocystis bryophila]